MPICYIENTPVDTRYYIIKKHELFSYYIEKKDPSLQIGAVWQGLVIEKSPHQPYGFVDIGKDTPLFIKKIPTSCKVGDYLIVQIIKEAYQHKFPVASPHITLKTAEISLSWNEFVKTHKKKPFISIEQSPHAITVHPLSTSTPLQLNEHVQILQKRIIPSSTTKKTFLGQGFSLLEYLLWQNPFITEVISHPHDTLNLPSSSYLKTKENKDILKILKEENILTYCLQGHNKKITLTSSKTSINIEHTQSATLIDVDNHLSSPQQTILQTNKEAFHTIIKHIILRHISGIIILDLIHMPYNEQKNFHQWCTQQNIPDDLKILGFTKAGMLEMIRSRNFSPLPQSPSISPYNKDFFARNIVRELYTLKNSAYVHIQAQKETINHIQNTYKAHLDTLTQDYQISVTFKEGYDTVTPILSVENPF